MSKDFWDVTKQDPLVEAALKHVRTGNALDIGGGEGRDALFLARNNFDVIVVDSDADALRKLSQSNESLKKPVTIIETNINAYTPDQQFDLVICDMVLHFLAPEEVVSMTEKMKAWTKPDGVIMIAAYTDKNPAGKRPYLFKTNELKQLYAGWRILYYAEKPTPWFHWPRGTEPRHNEAVYFLAQKP